MSHTKDKSFNEPFAPRVARGAVVAVALALSLCVALACWWPLQARWPLAPACCGVTSPTCVWLCLWP